MKNKTIALAGNPNVGKSTVFNALTGMHQHTGNWPGKTVTNAAGNMKYKDATFDFIDLPGAYSLDSLSPDEAVTGEYIRSRKSRHNTYRRRRHMPGTEPPARKRHPRYHTRRRALREPDG